MTDRHSRATVPPASVLWHGCGRCALPDECRCHTPERADALIRELTQSLGDVLRGFKATNPEYREALAAGKAWGEGR